MQFTKSTLAVQALLLTVLVAGSQAQFLSGVTSVFGDATSGAAGAFTTATSGAAGAFSTATSGAGGAFSTATSGAGGAFSTATSGAAGAASSVSSRANNAAVGQTVNLPLNALAATFSVLVVSAVAGSLVL
ncbi:uncharacterized protein SRS1_11411 [Sporisorium reilianum f. sp. reilianum]|uniref:Uncharacterized protein n=1 Tax=Sporisorium reilianum f. sp. reilianum TaxID=72559 RepID=A0A2N8U520_9BASI|nr:uncharacterized protein SRS1_11411 [Sporisorium reilianum f. sp. reilianum]